MEAWEGRVQGAVEKQYLYIAHFSSSTTRSKRGEVFRWYPYMGRCFAPRLSQTMSRISGSFLAKVLLLFGFPCFGGAYYPRTVPLSSCTLEHGQWLFLERVIHG